MMDIPKVTDGEMNILEILWSKGDLKASDIVKELQASKNWNRNTTYTFINRLVSKGIVSREEPSFLCKALYTQEEVRLSETKDFVNKMFKGSFGKLLSTFINSDEINEKEIAAIEEILKKKKGV